jgi:hypothetical protein
VPAGASAQDLGLLMAGSAPAEAATLEKGAG